MRAGTAAAATAALVLAAGCGGGERQDADVRAATYTVEQPRISFPKEQELADETVMSVAVTNAGDEQIPNLAITVEADREGTQAAAFGTLSDQPRLASRSRPVWIVDESPGATAYANTWALGPVEPGATRTFRWRVSSIRAGRWRVGYRLAGALGNPARGVFEDGAPAAGAVTIDVSSKPGQARIDANGDVVRVPGRDFDEQTR